MGVYEDLLGQTRVIPDALPFPELLPKEGEMTARPKKANWWDNLLPPEKRAIVPGMDVVNSAQPAIQAALGNAPRGPAIPPQFSVNAGMLPPLDAPPGQTPFLTPAEKQLQASVGGDMGPDVPLPLARPAGAPPPILPGLPGSSEAGPVAPSSGDGGGEGVDTDISASRRAGVPIAIAPNHTPQEAAKAGLSDTPAPGMLPSILDRIRQGLGDNSNTLLALGAGLAGAPNIGQGISRAAAAAIPARAADIQQSLAAQSRQYGTRALVEAGVPIQQAIAAQADPELRKALITSYITDRGKDIKMIKTKDPWGGETEVPYVVNKYAKDGEPVLSPAFTGRDGAAAPVPGSNTTGTAIYAPGINQSNFDHSKVGEDYIQQFSPEMQSDAKAYLAGRSLPTGRQGGAQVVKQIAKKYGDDIGMPADDAIIGQRKQWANSLADTVKGVGLSSKGFKQGLEHFVGLSDNLVKMNLSNGMGIEPVAGAINSMKNLTTEQKRLVNKNDVFGQALAREMGNLFAKNGGGVHEAAETKKNISNSTMSGKAAAGSLEAIDELMQGGLRTLEGRRDELFPNGNAPPGSQFLGPKQEAQLAHIRRNIALLKGENPDATAASSPAARPVSGFKPGGSYKMLPDGTVVPK